MAKRCELAGELWLVGDDENEFRTGAIGIPRQQRRSDRALGERNFAELGFQSKVEAPRPILGSRLRIPGLRIAALDNSMRHHAMEDGAFIESLFCEFDE